MYRYTSYLNTTQKIIETYSGDIPLSAFLKTHFAQHKKHGSTDRKQITHLCYCYFRLGKALQTLIFNERIKVAFYLCNSNNSNYHFLYNEEWINNWNDSVVHKINFVQQQYSQFSVDNIFDFTQFLSPQINSQDFAQSHLQQPFLFLRVRPNFQRIVQQKLHQAQIVFNQINDNCIVLNNSTKVENILSINKEVVVQDYSSQQVGELMLTVKNNIQSPINLWDCCAASGGKSILAKDVFGNINITVSDIRTSIIANLRKRFSDAGIHTFQSHIINAAEPTNIFNKKFNFIICDVPCTGSGTWARTPEQLQFFNNASISNFEQLQRQIAINATNHLQLNGFLLYITCSVFTNENENVVQHVLANTSLKLIDQKYFVGYSLNADSMFGALFQKT